MTYYKYRDTIQVVHKPTSLFEGDHMKSKRSVPQKGLLAKLASMQNKIKHLENQVAVLQELADVDPLTGLLNRRGLEKAFDAEMSRISRTGETVTVVCIDLNHFKQINDTHGHPVGDKVLRKLGEILKKTSRRTDLVARTGGDEFVIVFPGASAVSNLAHVDHIREMVKNDPVLASTDHPQICVTASFGMAESSEHHAMDDLFKLADAALYRAKQSGRDQVIHSNLH